jgi:hypothetical protein
MIVAFPASILPSRFLMRMMKGIEPRMSITEKRMRVTENISFRLNIGRRC